MSITSGRRRELIAIGALLVGVFIALAMQPWWDVTGPLGRAVGRVLPKYFGLGAAMIAMLGIFVGLAGFGRFQGLGLRRASVLIAGLVLLLPFAIAIAIGVRSADDFPANYTLWSAGQRLVGIVPGLIAVLIRSVIGTAGAIILGVLALSSLTVYTLDWHPFRRLAPGEKKTTKNDRARREAKKKTAERAESDAEFPTATISESEVFVAASGGKGKTKQETSGFLAKLARRRRQPEEAERLPPLDLLQEEISGQISVDEDALEDLGEVLIDTLRTFRVDGKVVGRTTGPVVTQFEVAPAPGVKVGRIASLADDLALAMRAKSIRIVAPIPGKAAVGVEVPNPSARIVPLRELLETRDWEETRGTLPIALGKDLEGRPRVADLERMPHLLIAGATGSGKSVCINTIITSLVYRYTPRQLRLLMIDPKMVELSVYNTLPHLRHPVVTDNKQAAQALKWALHEMERRYELFHANQARNIQDFNRKVTSGKPLFHPLDKRQTGDGKGNGEQQELRLAFDEGPLPLIVIIVDELADLMMTVQADVEKPLAILAQKARATGIHLILATQRPSVNVITGLIKANFPSRIAFRVASKVDSRTILDQNGAETLLGNGDMLFLPPGKSEPVRVQGAFITMEETEDLMSWYRERQAERDAALAQQGQAPPEDGEADILEVVTAIETEQEGAGAQAIASAFDRDPLFKQAAETCVSHQLGSTSLLQRKLRIGYGRAARIVDQLYEAGVLGPPEGSKPREVLVGMGELDEL